MNIIICTESLRRAALCLSLTGIWILMAAMLPTLAKGQQTIDGKYMIPIVHRCTNTVKQRKATNVEVIKIFDAQNISLLTLIVAKTTTSKNKPEAQHPVMT